MKKAMWISRTAAVLLMLFCAAATRAADTGVSVEEHATETGATLAAVGTTCIEATITISAQLDNMTSSVPLPVTIDLSAGQTNLAIVTFTVKDADKAWGFTWKGSWKYGHRLLPSHVIPDYTYSLPYRSGAFTVLQGAGGAFSHRAGTPDEQAVDFEMPIGTPVAAARSGVVVAVRSDCTEGGLEPRLKLDGNYVVIRHADGTYAEYLHLMHNGVLVRLGETVAANRTIALSGNTGFTSTPHLHFMVFYNIDGSTRRSVPVTFGSAHGTFKATEGIEYRSGG